MVSDCEKTETCPVAMPQPREGLLQETQYCETKKFSSYFPQLPHLIFRSTRDVAEIGPEIGSVQGASMTDRVDLICLSLLFVSPRARY